MGGLTSPACTAKKHFGRFWPHISSTRPTVHGQNRQKNKSPTHHLWIKLINPPHGFFLGFMWFALKNSICWVWRARKRSIKLRRWKIIFAPIRSKRCKRSWTLTSKGSYRRVGTHKTGRHASTHLHLLTTMEMLSGKNDTSSCFASGGLQGEIFGHMANQVGIKGLSVGLLPGDQGDFILIHVVLRWTTWMKRHGAHPHLRWEIQATSWLRSWRWLGDKRWFPDVSDSNLD